ncbi:hypothetical protein Ssi02_37510 [Sinosporangium siamense]|uniref:GH26 domain-containing protein n=2 Tax=Sinosporangium siamense TaxID=1367973 RepID=A0A919RGL5_9ACTN|nr:hypothetical protein Ssi02_37510 [Sinosporangium siamense]
MRASRSLLIVGVTATALVNVAALVVAEGEAKAEQRVAAPGFTVAASEDTYVTTHDQRVAKGKEWHLRTGTSSGQRRTLLKFAVSNLPPAACDITAQLRLWPRRATAGNEVTTVSRVGQGSWNEGTLWASRPTVGQALDTAQGLQSNTWAAFDVSQAVRANGEVSFTVTHQGTSHLDFASRENRQVNRPPQLAINYKTDCGGGTVPTPGPTPKPTVPTPGPTTKPTTQPTGKPTAGPTPGPGDGALWGLYRSGNADITVHEGTRLNSTTVPRRFDAFRRYYSFSQIIGTPPNQTVSWPSKRDAELARDRDLFLLFDSGCFGKCPTSFNGIALPKPVKFTGSNVPTDFTGEWFHPRDVASGRFDPLLRAIAKKIKAFPSPLILDISSEIDSQVEWMGNTPLRKEWLAGYRAMWRHIHDLFVKEGVTNVTWNYVVGGFANDDLIYTESYPGDAYVDWISWDPYDNGCSHGSAYGTLGRFYNRLEAGLLGQGARNKTYGIMEFGFGKRCQQAYFKNMAADLKRLPKIRAVLYFDRPNMPYTLTEEGWRGYALSGMDQYFNTDD